MKILKLYIMRKDDSTIDVCGNSEDISEMYSM